MSDTPWMDFARAELGTRRVSGKGSNKKVLDYFAEAGHPEIRDDDVAYCAAFAGAMLKRAEYPNTGSLAARSYLNYGSKLDEPREGCIAVFSRSNSSWEGHVAFFLEETGNSVKVLGGNQNGGAVTISSYPKSKLLGYRWPVAPTIEALREAGSEEIADADMVRKTVKYGGGAMLVGQGAEKSGALDGIRDAADGLGIIGHAMNGLHMVLKFAMTHAWIAITVGVIGGGYWLSRRIEVRRIAKAIAGHPLFKLEGK